MQILFSLFGAGFTLVTAYALGLLIAQNRKAPFEIVLALGAVAQSLIVFLLLLGNAAYWWTLLAAGTIAVALAARKARWSRPCGPVAYTTLLFVVYGAWYFVNALAPE